MRKNYVVDANILLHDPQSITIAVNPDQPKKFEEIMGIANQAPQTLPDVLSVDVTANN